MLEFIDATSNILMLFFFWVGIPALLISMLCIVGFQYTGRPSLILALTGFIALAGFIISLNLRGLVSGETLSIGRLGPTMINRADGEIKYWITTALWFSTSLPLLAYCIKKFFVLIFKPKLKTRDKP
ncbi:hypothetical protein ABHF91_00435 [Pseudaeromonas sp. ZJS20]|uniref:hypothetical protein n=1 Tax=Pseudaeromonas aegiceratis TaxID=3153928 RepID=UPI00390CD030